MEYPSVPRSVARQLDRLAFAPQVTGLLAALAELGAVVAPSECVFCQAPDTVLCPTCRGAFRAATVRPFAAQYGAEGLPLLEDGQPLPTMAAGHYAREVSAAMLAFKNRQRVGLAAVLAPALAGSIQAAVAAGSGPAALVPIPSTRISRARRGYCPVDLLLQWITRRGLLPPQARVVRALRVRPRPPWSVVEQKSKGRRARSRTAELDLRPDRALAGCRVVLLDDVLTTGSTLARGYRALTDAGAVVESAAVLAATAPPRRTEADDDAAARAIGRALP